MIFGFALSVAFVLVFRTDYVTTTANFFDKHFLRGLDFFPPRPGEFAGAIRTPVVLVDHVGSPEYYEIESAYENIELPPGVKLSFLPQPFRAGVVAMRQHGESDETTVIMWPSGCHEDGCRHDLLVRDGSKLRLLAKVFAFELATTDRFKNGYRILAELDGSRYFWWDGDQYVSTN